MYAQRRKYMKMYNRKFDIIAANNFRRSCKCMKRPEGYKNEYLTNYKENSQGLLMLKQWIKNHS